MRISPTVQSITLGIALTLASLSSATTAHAQERICAPTVSHAELDDKLKIASFALEKMKIDQANDLLSTIYSENFKCMASLIDPSYLARYAKLQAEAYWREDEYEGLKWAQLAVLADPSTTWSDKYPQKNIAFELKEAGAPVLAGPTDKGLAPPPKGGIFLNGILLTSPQAYIETPGLIQIIDKKQRIVAAYWQDGVVFRDEWLGEPSEIKSPKWYSGPQSAPLVLASATPSKPAKAAKTPKPDKVKKPKVKKPKSNSGNGKMIRLASGAGMGIASALLYGMATASQTGVRDANTIQGLADARAKTNNLVIASGVMGIAATGLCATTLVSDQPTLTFRFRF